MSLPVLEPVLHEGVGWFMVLGFGLMFSLLTMFITNLERRSLGKVGAGTSEEFASAGRNLGMGLVASDIVSQWTWAATLLMSSNMAWRVGISGSYWYAAGASVQIMLFAILATQVKRRAPNMRTFMEIVRVRWGVSAHKVFICFALTTNVIVSAMLILGGAATLNALTGMTTWAAAFLIPIVACLPYTLMGGLKATFLAHYFNTLFIFIALFVFMFGGFVGGGDNDKYGSPGRVIDALDEASRYNVIEHTHWVDTNSTVQTDATRYGLPGMSAFIKNQGICYEPTASWNYKDAKDLDKSCQYEPIGVDEWCADQCRDFNLDVQACGNLATGCITTGAKDHFKQSGCDTAAGEICGPSLATMDSPSGLIFGVVNIVGNFGTVFVDQSYWQGAIAVKPESAASGFILGGIVWFTVPMMMGSIHGLVGRALTTDFSLPNGASYITAGDSGAGLAPARVAVEMYGDFGAWLLLIMLFMAIVSTGSAEIIAVATIVTFDVYCEYVHPELKESRVQQRNVYYAAVIGNGKRADDVTVDDIVAASADTTQLIELPARVESLKAAGFFSESEISEDQMAEINGKLRVRAEKDGAVTNELVYYALQSTVLAKTSIEAAVILRVMKFFCCCFAAFMGFLAVFLQRLELNLGFVYMSMGIFVGPAVCPAAMAILMEKANGTWCTLGAVGGLIGGIITWVVAAQVDKEEVTQASLGGDYPFLYSNLVSILFSGAIAILGSMANPDTKFQWAHLSAKLPLVDDMPPVIEEGRTAKELDEFLIQSFMRSSWMAIFLFIFLCLILPMSLYWSGVIFEGAGFGVWIMVFLVWCFIGGMTVIILPIVDFKRDLARVKVKSTEGENVAAKKAKSVEGEMVAAPVTQAKRAEEDSVAPPETSP